MKRKKKKEKVPTQGKAEGNFGLSFGDLLKKSGIDTPKVSKKTNVLASPPPIEEEVEASDPFDLSYNEKIVVRREKKGRGGKTVTIVRGLELHADELMMFAQDIRKQLGCGASIEDRAMVIQGDQCQRVKAILEGKGATKVVLG